MPSTQEQTVEGNSSSDARSGTSSGGGDAVRGKDQPGTMFHAARVGDADFIQSEILNGADVNEKDSNGERYVRCDDTIRGWALLTYCACFLCLRLVLGEGGMWLTHPYSTPRTSTLMSSYTAV